MKVSSIRIISVSSNGEIDFPAKELTLYNFKLIAINSQMNLTIKFYDKSGLEQTATSTPIQNAMSLYGQYVTFSKIVFSDPNPYNIIGIYQVVKADNEREYEQLKEQMNIDLAPINSMILVSPLDVNGYVATDDVLLNSKINKLNQDSAGNVGVIMSKSQNYSVLLNGSITTNTSWTYKPVSEKISVLIHITSVSGTSPSLTLNVFAIDPTGNVLVNDPIATSSQITSATDQVINIDLYGVNQIQITATVSGTSPSFTGTISVIG